MSGLILIGYLRQSVQNGGDSLDAQRDAILSWADAEGFTVQDFEQDDGKSGALGVLERPGLARAVAAIADGRASGIVVHRIDRLSRKLHTQEAILGRVWQDGGRAFTADGGGEIPKDDPLDPYRTFVRQVMGAAAELERALVVARMQGGRRRKAARGGFVGGAVPFGFDLADDGSLVPNEREQAAIALARGAREGGMTLKEIAVMLAAEGFASRGAAWHAASVRRVLMRTEVTPSKPLEIGNNPGTENVERTEGS